VTAPFTPGPWAIDEPGRPWICTVGNNSNDPAIFGAASPVGEPFVWGDKQADARLIAEAPAMFDLLAVTREILRDQAQNYVDGKRRPVPPEMFGPVCMAIDSLCARVLGAAP
jgi:hypothetical protein